jgi:hypothetical protein
MKDFVKQAKQLVWNNEVESFVRQDPELSANREKEEGNESFLFETPSEQNEGGNDKNHNILIRISDNNRNLNNINNSNLKPRND